MSPLLSRLLLAILLIPAAALLYTITFVACWQLDLASYPFRNRTAWISAMAVTWVFVAVSWLLLWRKTVQWTRARKHLTVLTGGASAIVGGVVGFLFRGVGDDFGFFVFSTVSPLVWMACTVVTWRESPAERSARPDDGGDSVVCPNCGYSLRGLQTARCPECGSSFTLEELLNRQPRNQARELEEHRG